MDSIPRRHVAMVKYAGCCRIYDQRPTACRGFPHTHKKGFIWRTYGHAANTLNCPAVYQIVTKMQQQRHGLF